MKKNISLFVYAAFVALIVLSACKNAPTVPALTSLPRSTPEAEGVSSEGIITFLDSAAVTPHEFHSIMILRHGKVVAEGWWSPYGRAPIHMLYSLSKSFTSTAVGLAVAEGRFSIDDPVLAFFPGAAPEANDFLSRLRVRHLLSMTTGQGVDTWANMVGRPDGNWMKGFFEVPLLHEPGTYFLYNTGATYLLSAIVQKTSGVKLNDYLAPRLYAPLGIQAASWTESKQGITTGGIGLSLRTEEVARSHLAQPDREPAHHRHLA